MLLKFHKFSAALLCCTAFVGCSDFNTKGDEVTRVDFTGYYNDIAGTLSDGTHFEGKGWFNPGEPRGQFCLQTETLTCSGTYSAGLSKRISGKFYCSDGTTGRYRTERIEDGNFVRPVIGKGKLSDGRTAVATFSAIKNGTDHTLCLR